MGTNEGVVEVTSVDVSSGDGGDSDLGDYVAGLLRTFDDRVYKGEHHDGVTPMPVQKSEDDEVEPSSLPEDDSIYNAFSKAGALEPPLPPDFFVEVMRISNILRQNIQAFATNIDGFGHHFDPILDLDSDDAFRLAKDKVLQELDGKTVTEKDLDQLVAQRIERFLAASTRERIGLDSFFEYAGHGGSYPALRKMTRFDLELIGYGGWEVLRNKKGNVSKFKHVPAYTLRLLSADTEPTRIIEHQRRGAPWETEEVPVFHHFRRYVYYQGGARRGGATIYLKDFLDPRVVSRKTGNYYETVAQLRDAEGQDSDPANELLFFKLPSMDSPYGEPRWIGNLLSVLGSRSAEEVNFLFFRNKSIPPMVLLISGGKVKPGDADALKKKISKELHGGPEKFHAIIVVTASTDPASGSEPKIEFKPLTEAMFKDQLFGNYDEANRNKVSESFLIPPLLRGVTKDFNRATAKAALQFAEGQVFQGERSEFDWLMNYCVLPQLLIAGERVCYHRFVSNGPPLRDPESVVDMVQKLVLANVMTPAEARRELASVGFSMDKIDEPWTKRPVQITVTGVGFTPEEGERIVEEEGATTYTDPEDEEGKADAQTLRLLEQQGADGVKTIGVEGSDLQRLNRNNVRRDVTDPGE